MTNGNDPVGPFRISALSTRRMMNTQYLNNNVHPRAEEPFLQKNSQPSITGIPTFEEVGHERNNNGVAGKFALPLAPPL